MMKRLFRTGDGIGLNKRSSAFLFLFTICLLTVIHESKANTTRDPLVITLTCPSDVTINCGSNTLPASTGNPNVSDPCDPTPNINFYDYPYTPPANGEEMRWVILPPGSTAGSCTSGTNCSISTICLGLQYTPSVAGTLTSYTTGFIMNCLNGINPITYNASCVMDNNSGVIDSCASLGLMLLNSSGNSGGVPVQKYVPKIIHQVCFQLAPGAIVLFDEDEGTDLTTSIDLPGGGTYSGTPAFTNYTLDYDAYCSDPCPYPYSIYRRFVITDDCNQLATCIQHIDIKDDTPPSLTCPPNITIVYPASTLPANTGNATATDLCDATLQVTYTDSVPTLPCAASNFIKRKWSVVDDCGNSSKCTQFITINDAGSICGSVKNDFGQGVGGITIQLFADVNNNLNKDGPDTLVATTTTNATTGIYCFNNIRPCNYIVFEIQPVDYVNIADYDTTPDPDGNDSAEGPDNQIPVTLGQVESDMDNNFTELVCAGSIPTLPFDTICAGQSVTLQVNLNLGSATYSWNFGSGSTPGTGMGLGPHTVSYVTTTQNQNSGASVVMTITKPGCTTISGQVTLIDVNPKPNAAINASTSPICYYTNKAFQPAAPQIPGASYNWNFGVDAVPATITGYGPHNVYYTSDGTKTVKLVVYPNEAGAQCPDSATVSFLVNSCPAQIVGYVKSNTDVPINNVTLKLFVDADHNGAADNTDIIRQVTTNEQGLYVMASLFPGNYVLQETQPAGWNTLNDLDSSDDGDLAVNVSGTDNLIPLTLIGSELDSMNNFIETALPGSISGSVFADYSGNLLPDPGEGISGVTIKLLADNNANGVADNNTPIATQVSDANGDFVFSMVSVGNYVITETTPANYFSTKDYDPTNDSDVVTNTNMNNDTIPVSMMPNEGDANNYFIDAPNCPLIVTNEEDGEYGSFRYAVNCANPGDTIRFHSLLTGETIWLFDQKIILNKNLNIVSALSPRVTIASVTLGLFTVQNNVTVLFKELNLISGDVIGAEGAAFDNSGTLKLHNVTITKNSFYPAAVRLIRNQLNSSLFLSGTCNLQQ